MSDTQASITKPNRIPVSALTTLFTLTIRQLLRGKRLIVMMFLFSLPALLTLFIRSVDNRYDATDVDEQILFMFFPNALVPLSAVLFASSVIQDEMEDQTLTYLLLRPIPRWALYATKLVAAWLVTALVCTVFTFVTCATVYFGESNFAELMTTGTALKVSIAHALALAAYCGIFGLCSLYTRRSLILGIGYIVLIEGLLASYEFVIRRVAVVFYYRVIVTSWLGREFEDWSIDLDVEPSTIVSVWSLVGIAFITLLWASFTFENNEFRVKTPEGS